MSEETIEEKIARIKAEALALSEHKPRDYSSSEGYFAALERWIELHPAPEIEDGFDFETEMHYLVKDGVFGTEKEEAIFAVINYVPHLIGTRLGYVDGLSVHGELQKAHDCAKYLELALEKECTLWRRHYVHKGLLLINALENNEIPPPMREQLKTMWAYFEKGDEDENAELQMMGSKEAFESLYRQGIEQLKLMVPTLKDLMKEGNIKIAHGRDHSEVFLKEVEVDYLNLDKTMLAMTMPLLHCTFEDYLEDRVKDIPLFVETPPSELNGSERVGKWEIAVAPMAQIIGDFTYLLADIEGQIKIRENELFNAPKLDLTNMKITSFDPSKQQS